MDIKKILSDLENCPCGRKHTFDTEVVEVGSGITARAGEILAAANFPKEVLIVADDNTIKVSDGLLDSLTAAGFIIKKKYIFNDMKYAKIEQVREVELIASDVGGIISVGTGSLNDICRVASFELNKKFCIFATAPSMDGFASDSAPIIENDFKSSWSARQPMVILADTKILAGAPSELKAAGFGDMMAKYHGILDWKISNLLTGEYYCPAISDLTLKAVAKCCELADKIQSGNEESVGAVMEALVLSGLAMQLARSSRPASGSEHVLSHYWECYKLARGIWPEYHGIKVGVASVLMTKIYRNIADRVLEVNPHEDVMDWNALENAFSDKQIGSVRELNTPPITDKIDPKKLKDSWNDIRQLIYKELPETDELIRLMNVAGCPITADAIHVSPELFEAGLKYHSYMRYRVLLTRLLPMMDLNIMDFVD